MSANKIISSNEIATLTGKPHKNVLRKLRELREEGKVHAEEFDGKDSVGRRQPCFNLNKTESIQLVTNLSPESMGNLMGLWEDKQPLGSVALEIIKSGKCDSMTSLEVAELMGKRHRNVMRDIEITINTLDQDLTPVYKLLNYNNESGKISEYYELDKNMCILLVSRYDSSFLMKIIKRWQELEEIVQQPVIEPAQQPLLPYSIEEHLNAITMLSDIFNVNGADRIKMFEKGLKSYPDLKESLPSYNSSKFVGTFGEVSERVGHAYTFHKGNLKLELSAVAFNRLLIKKGFLQVIERSNKKPFKNVTEKGLEYGKNVVARQSTTATQPHWYDDTILEFYDIVVK